MRRAWAVGMVGLATTGLAGCGTANPFSIQKAYGATVSAKTARVTFKANLTGSGTNSGITAQITGAGVMDLNGHGVDLTAQIPVVGAIRIEEVGQILYMKLPSGLASSARLGLPGGKTWVKIDLAKAVGPNGLGSLDTFGEENPTQLLARLQNASTTGLVRVGQDKVDGVVTTRYRATIDPAREAAKAAAAPSATPMAKALAAQEAKITSLPVNVWVDTNNLLRRVEVNLSIPSGGSIDETMNLYDFGTPVSITPPPPAQTMDASALSGFNQATRPAQPGAAPGA